MAEGVGFEPTTPVSQSKRLAGARTRPLCDPSRKPHFMYIYYITNPHLAQSSAKVVCWPVVACAMMIGA